MYVHYNLISHCSIASFHIFCARISYTINVKRGDLTAEDLVVFGGINMLNQLYYVAFFILL